MDSFCPLCDSAKIYPVFDSLYRCRKCGCAFSGVSAPLAYDDDYFTAGYLKQYGRTYEDDFPQIYKTALVRMERIQKMSAYRKERILDIGCALGFFLKAALDRGFASVKGIEISAYASNYCAEKFGFDVLREDFEKIPNLGIHDAITAWYFIEHCCEPFKAVEKIFASLAENGVFAFSAPSVFGPMYGFHKNEWAALRPSDHRVDFTPGSARRMLKRAGFKKVKIYAAGFHPERVISDKRFFYKAFCVIYNLFAKLTGYSDTIEVYAAK
ncbi:MAG: class I SAM-dependent methyltransferase [Spirochaetia bacterium]|jgi:SAM-dependent methyltransferase|nr:class I SAM-dependent methyltransferase [Spirochaetia bacterium]